MHACGHTCRGLVVVPWYVPLPLAYKYGYGQHVRQRDAVGVSGVALRRHLTISASTTQTFAAAASPPPPPPPPPPPKTGVILVESPAKARKLQKWLGDDFKVLATIGHVRELIGNKALVAERNDADADDGTTKHYHYKLNWSYIKNKRPLLRSIAEEVEKYDSLVLMTDPDREGEAIAWHVVQALDEIMLNDKSMGVVLSSCEEDTVERPLLAVDTPSKPRQSAAATRRQVTVSRCVFQEVTERAVREALSNPRHLSASLVDAALARRCLDHLFGFHVSPLLWQKMPGCPSAGRVQSVALRLLCERERELMNFKPGEYFTIVVRAMPVGGADDSRQGVELIVQSCGDLTSSNDDDEDDDEEEGGGGRGQARDASVRAGRFASYDDAVRVVELLRQNPELTVTDVVRGKMSRRNPPPFTTSTMQQKANQVLGMSGTRCMTAAQRLYEGAGAEEGLITYMRTDSSAISPRADEELRDGVAELLGSDFVLGDADAGTNRRRKKQAGVQGAHEAIRPTNPMLTPKILAGMGSWRNDELRLYALIWERAMASRCAPTRLATVRMEVEDATASVKLKATASYVTFDGARKLRDRATWYQDEPLETGMESWWANLGAGDSLELRSTAGGEDNPEVTAHLTSPPRRYNDGSIVKKMESIGVGRPSTYATILEVLRKRQYVDDRDALAASGVGSGVLRPTSTGRLLTEFLIKHFPSYVDYGFTASMEKKLDTIARSEDNSEGEEGDDKLQQLQQEDLTGQMVLDSFWDPLQATIADKMEHLSTSGVIDELNEELCPELCAVLLDHLANAEAAAAAADIRRPTCPECGKAELSFKPSRSGRWFIGCSDHPKCSYSLSVRDLENLRLLSHAGAAVTGSLPATVKRSKSFVAAESAISEEIRIVERLGKMRGFPLKLGTVPAAWLQSHGLSEDAYGGSEIWARDGPYGPYFALEPREGVDERMVRATASKDDVSEICLEMALVSLEGSLGRNVGENDVIGGPLVIYQGHFGPYVDHKLPEELVQLGAPEMQRAPLQSLVKDGTPTNMLEVSDVTEHLERYSTRIRNRALKYMEKVKSESAADVDTSPELSYRDTLVWLGRHADLVDASNPRSKRNAKAKAKSDNAPALSKMLKSDLVAECKARGVDTSGTRPELQARLRQARKKEKPLESAI
ncbi:DNA topoisomerase [Pseudoscourfieldia marina]